MMRLEAELAAAQSRQRLVDGFVNAVAKIIEVHDKKVERLVVKAGLENDPIVKEAVLRDQIQGVEEGLSAIGTILMLKRKEVKNDRNCHQEKQTSRNIR